MKFNCFKTDLVAAVSNVSRAVSPKAAMPALEGVLIKAYGDSLNISGYNLEIGITTDIDATIGEEGEIVVGARLFLDIIRRLPEEVILVETDERMVTYITSGHANYQIVGISSVEYPDLPVFEKKDYIKISADKLRDMIRQTVYAVSENMAKPIYTGSLFELEKDTLRIVAVDGCRMAIRNEATQNERETSFVVPGKTQQEVLKLLTDDDDEIEIIVGQRHIMFKVKNYRVISRLLEGTFLEYKATIPRDQKTEIVIKTRVLIEALERMTPLNSEKMQSPVKCVLSNDEIRLSCASTIGKATDIISIPIIGEETEVGFNNRYMLDALKNTDTDEVKMIFNGSVSPVIIKPVEGEDFLNLVALMRLSNDN